MVPWSIVQHQKLLALLAISFLVAGRVSAIFGRSSWKNFHVKVVTGGRDSLIFLSCSLFVFFFFFLKFYTLLRERSSYGPAMLQWLSPGLWSLAHSCPGLVLPLLSLVGKKKLGFLLCELCLLGIWIASSASTNCEMIDLWLWQCELWLVGENKVYDECVLRLLE